MQDTSTHQILHFMGINRDTQTAGPGKRLELFTKGCIRGVVSPCEGCFNESTWTFEGLSRQMTVQEVVDICNETSWNRQVTFCGGEPILQAKAIAMVAKKLKELDPSFHFVMYTAYKLDSLMKYGLKFTWVKEKHGVGMYNALLSYSDHVEVIEVDEAEGCSTKAKFIILTPNDVKELMSYIDLIVDGDYQMDKRLTTNKYMHEGWFIGSSNQRVIQAPESVRQEKLVYTEAAVYNEQRQSMEQCKCCGHEVTNSLLFCNDVCSQRYAARKEEMKLLGGI